MSFKLGADFINLVAALEEKQLKKVRVWRKIRIRSRWECQYFLIRNDFPKLELLLAVLLLNMPPVEQKRNSHNKENKTKTEKTYENSLKSSLQPVNEKIVEKTSLFNFKRASNNSKRHYYSGL